MIKKLMLALLLIVGICAVNAVEKRAFREKITARYVEKFDFAKAFDHSAWKLMPGSRMLIDARSTGDFNRAPAEEGSVKLLWDDNYLYVRGDLADSDIMTTAVENNQHFYLMGDLLEFFVKPLEQPYYWEIYGTPNQLHTAFHFPSKGDVGLPSGFASPEIGVKVATQLEGTFNVQSDRDRAWHVIIAVPRKELEKYGCKIGPGSKWTMLGARYNYSCHLPQCELSSFPQMPGSYHTTTLYAEIEFVK